MMITRSIILRMLLGLTCFQAVDGPNRGSYNDLSTPEFITEEINKNSTFIERLENLNETNATIPEYGKGNKTRNTAPDLKMSDYLSYWTILTIVLVPVLIRIGYIALIRFELI